MQETDQRGHTITPKHHSRMIAKIMTERANRCHLIPTMNNNNAQRSNRPPCDSHSTAALSNYRGSSGTYHCLCHMSHDGISHIFWTHRKQLGSAVQNIPGALGRIVNIYHQHPNARPLSGGRDWTPASTIVP